MDKELLRVVIIATGLLVIMGLLLWSYLKNKEAKRAADFFDDPDFKGKTDHLSIRKAADDFDVVPVKTTRYDAREKSDQLFSDFDEDFQLEEEGLEEEEIESSPRFITPAIIQFSIVAKADAGFNGLDLTNAFQIVGLEYGSLKIYERLDANRLVDFGVACMVEPGTFPSTNLESFYCPGVVFFMQPGALEDAVAVFDDFIETIKLLAIELEGEVLDHQRQPLTETTIQLIRQSL